MNYGYIPSKKDVRDYKLCSANVPQEYPEEFALTNLPKVKNQQNVNSCCSHVVTSILEYYDKNKHTLSTNFIYGIQHKLFNQNQMGMMPSQACKIVHDYGCPLEVDCKGNNEVPVAWGIAEAVFKDKEIMDKAYQFRTLSYYLCKNNEDIKYALMNYGPVLGAVDWKNDFTLDKNSVISFNKNSSGGGHAIMIYGWNKDGWLIQNSWGTSFGNKGRFILPYSYGFLEARAMVDYENENDLALVKPNANKKFKFLYKLINAVANFFNNLAAKLI